MISAKDYLAQFGISMEVAFNFVAQNIGNPSLIYGVALNGGLTNQMLAEIIQINFPSIQARDVMSYFDANGLAGNKLGLPNSPIIGTESSDGLYGSWQGDDLVYGKGGIDNIYVNSGSSDEIGNDIVYGGNGADTIAGNHSDQLFGENGDDEIFIFLDEGNDYQFPLIVPGEGRDSVSVNYDSRTIGTALATIDLAESVSAIDDVYFSLPDDGQLETPVINIVGVDPTQDRIHGSPSVAQIDLYGTNGTHAYLGADAYASYIQIVNSPTEVYRLPLEGINVSRTVDDYGKGFFVIQGASAASADISAVAQFLDAYGNNATYATDAVHMFLVNTGTNQCSLYRFEDGYGANSDILPSELIPIVTLIGITTESLSVANVEHMFDF